jgi:nicotinamide-nucleotide amidase
VTAEIVSIGTELLAGQIADTNAQAIGAMLPELGIEHRHRQTVGDVREHIVDALRLALSRSEIVITIGGLGPTEDDLTREGVAEALDEPLVQDPRLAETLRRVFALRKIPWTESQLRQALRPECASPIDNPNGTAPGLICEKQGKTLICLPGPRTEFLPMLEGPVRECLRSRSPDRAIASRTLRITGLGESMVEEKVRELLHLGNPAVAPYAHPGQVDLRITAQADSVEAARSLIEPVERRIRAILGDAVFGVDDQSLEEAVLDLLRTRGETLAVAESCTGGMLGGRITSVPGASDVFLGGVISYSNEIKERLLGVSPVTLKEQGAVSEACAREMALGARGLIGADWALSVTGIAGPGRAGPSKPVGLVFVGCAGTEGGWVEGHRFRGNREAVRLRSVQSALTLLRARLLAAH